jgi:hypothetical protein
MLLAFSTKPEELDILMLSLTFGNVEVQKYVPGFSYYSSYEDRACHSAIPLYILHNDGFLEDLEADPTIVAAA